MAQNMAGKRNAARIEKGSNRASGKEFSGGIERGMQVG